MDKLRKARAPVRAQMTKTGNEVKALLGGEDPNKQTLMIKASLMRDLNLQLEDLNMKIMDLMIDNDKIEEQAMEAEMEDTSRYKEAYLKCQLEIDRVCASPVPVTPAPSAVSENGEGIKKTFKLPELQLKMFNGELKDWLGFWSQFEKIDSDDALHPSDKFQYLLQAMVEGSKARDVVESYPQTGDNYPKALQALRDRFGRNDLLVEVYVRELLKLVITNACQKDQISISKLHDQLESHLRSLESLKVTSDKYDSILYPLVESCLPVSLMHAWQRSSGSKRDGSQNNPKTKLSCLMAFLRNEVESEQRIQLACEGFGMTPSPVSSERKNKPKQFRKLEEAPATAAGLINSGEGNHGDNKCAFCEKQHESRDCFKAQRMSLQSKMEILKRDKRCFNCFRLLKRDHRAKGCPVKCVVCGGKHHVLLCPSLPSHSKEGIQEEATDTQTVPSTTTSCFSYGGQIMLQTLMVELKAKGTSRKVRVLFDTGSQRSVIMKSTAQVMEYTKLGTESIVHVLFGGVTTKEVNHSKYNVTMSKLDGTFSCDLTMLDNEKICGVLPSVTSGQWMSELRKHNIWIDDIGTDREPIEILIGSDYYGRLQTGNVVQLQCGLTAVETRLGWTVMGKFQNSNSSSPSTSMLVTSLAMSEMSIQDLWRLEVIGIQDPIELKSQEDKDIAVQQQFLKTVRRAEDGRYEVSLPWSNGQQFIPNNREVAMKRLLSTTRKLKNANRFQSYEDIFKEWESEGIIEVVSEGEDGGSSHYLPHRPVFKEDSLTTKVRPVFDASCKTGRAPSLNDCLEKGPNLIDLIPAIMLRFRKEKIGVISDIRKAFLMINVQSADRPFLRFLWWDSEECQKVKVYQHKRVVFGVNCSPYLLGAVIRYHLDQYKDKRMTIAEQLKLSLYVDNCVTSLSSHKELDTFINTSTEIMAEARLDLRLWQDSSNVTSDSADRIVSVLGMKWDRFEDTLFCDVNACEPDMKITKRKILSVAQKIFDPMGIVAPVTLIPKLMLQQTWAQKKGWDEPVDENIQDKFQKWVDELPFLAGVKIPRWFSTEEHKSSKWSLHTFCDASAYAYAAVVFLRCEGNPSTVQLLQAKSRVAPLKAKSIPRLELLSCVIASRLASSVNRALIQELPMWFWSDSTTALAWIKRNDTWGTFVGNQVRKILSLTEADQWRHVPGKLNPADLPSRGCQASSLLNLRWWEGPSWLKEEPSSWPGENPEEDEAAICLEKKKSAAVCLNRVSAGRPWYMRRSLFYGYNKIVYQMAYVRRFLNIVKNCDVSHGELTSEEVEAAEKQLVKLVQQEAIVEDKILPKLSVIKDEEGILRVQTKIVMREDEMNFRFPMLLPAKHPLVEELIKEEHLKSSHAGAQYLVNKLRDKFWILQSRKTINSVIHKCIRCRRFTAKNFESAPAPLPLERVRDASAFEIIGVDLAGPLFLKNREKVWIVLYTCAVYRALHLELVTSLDTEHFLQSFRRFVARRGRPRIVFSDNGTNFRGAVNLFRAVDWDEVKKKFLLEPIIWKFNPPAAPWWGGFWERLVRSVKGLLLRVLGKSVLTYEELITVICDVEAVINNRPLTTVTEDGDDLIALTPAMFVQGIRETGVPEVDVIDDLGFQRRFRYRQQLMKELRERFRKEYLGTLVQKFKDEKGQIAVGDIVFIHHETKKRLEWPMGKVLELVPGRDGVERVARIKTRSGELIRPIQRLYKAEVPSNDLPDSEEVFDSEKASLSPEVKVSKYGRLLKKPDYYRM